MALVSRGGWARSRKGGTLMAMHEVISGLLGHDRVKAARQHIERTDDVTLARQATLSAIPAPTGAEAQRAARVAELFREAGLRDVRIDEAGNVSGWVNGNGGTLKDSLTVGGKGEGVAPVVLSAHLDTVFGPDVDVSVERRGRRLPGPAISDNARGAGAPAAVDPGAPAPPPLHGDTPPGGRGGGGRVWSRVPREAGPARAGGGAPPGRGGGSTPWGRAPGPGEPESDSPRGPPAPPPLG